jgi:hypothetical protein
MKLLKVGLLIIILSVFSYGESVKLFNPGFKVGMNFTKQIFTRLEPLKYLYQPGFDVGLSNIITFNNYFSLLNDIYFSYTNSMIKYSTAGAVGPCHANYNNNYLRLSSSLGLGIFDKLRTFIGIDIGYLMKSKLTIYDREIANIEFKNNMKRSFPDFDFMLDIGICRNFNIFNNTYLF